jgi:hypothetical protein
MAKVLQVISPLSQIPDWTSPRTGRSPLPGTWMSAGIRANFPFKQVYLSEVRTRRREDAFTTTLCKIYRRVKFYSEQQSFTFRNSSYLRPTGYIQM